MSLDLSGNGNNHTAANVITLDTTEEKTGVITRGMVVSVSRLFLEGSLENRMMKTAQCRLVRNAQPVALLT